ncbi:MAG: DUF309 domain-containing protein [Prochlorococcus sp.]
MVAVVDQQADLDLVEDPRFKKGIEFFNAGDWYSAHDVFEELWHETAGPERKTIQGVLQVAVAQLHLESGNRRGATILYGEALGRLRGIGTPDLGFDLDQLCSCVAARLLRLQQDMDPDECTVPGLVGKA